MLQVLRLSGSCGYLIVIVSIVALTAFIERFIRLEQARIDTGRFLRELSYSLSERNMAEALRICDRVQSPIARVARAGLVHINEPQARLQNRIESVALVEIPLLEKNMNLISIASQIAPMLGLLGTVLGIIEAFRVIQNKATLVAPSDLAGGVWTALLTTAEGLIVAIPCLIGYNYLHNKIRSIRTDMERVATLVVDFALTYYEISDPSREYQSQT